ncbi:MAG: hypothetical protein KC620_14910 [Myxococcales bacterium]|nr:hypothetical protein [Myxococcales bacterium]
MRRIARGHNRLLGAALLLAALGCGPAQPRQLPARCRGKPVCKPSAGRPCWRICDGWDCIVQLGKDGRPYQSCRSP